jgi:hypothetical protein
MTSRLRGPGLAALLLLVWPLNVGAQAPPSARDANSGDVQALADKIDGHFAKQWAVAKVTPAAAAGDAEFMRRVYLDLAGRIPSTTEARTFLADTQPGKRQHLVEQLLASQRYNTHFTNLWRALLIPEANNNFLVRLQQETFEGWLKKRVAGNVGFDQLARDLLTAPVGNQGFGNYFGGSEPNALAFYTAKEFSPQNLAAGTARVFLGISVECAQCHNHPFAAWKKEQFWSFAAFFSGIRSQQVMDFLLPANEVPDSKQLTIAGTDKVVTAKFIDNTQPDWQPKVSTRATLAAWVTARDNPYFSRSAVNRIWAYFFGTGLIEPVDEIAGAGAATQHGDLLDALASEFVVHDFDMKFLIRAITASRTYQLSSASKDKSQADPALFARMSLRGLTGEQLFDSLVMATGYRDTVGGNDILSAITGGNQSARTEFLAKFNNTTERSTKVQKSILQALALMNGKVTADATTLERSETLAAIVDAPFLTTADRIDTLYLATLSRKPQQKELDRTVRFVDDAASRAKNARQDAEIAYNNALADVFWVLLNSSEFSLNH